jgi:hypothetical protein
MGFLALPLSMALVQTGVAAKDVRLRMRYGSLEQAAGTGSPLRGRPALPSLTSYTLAHVRQRAAIAIPGTVPLSMQGAGYVRSIFAVPATAAAGEERPVHS